MKVVKIRKINPISAFKVGMGVGTLVGLIAAIIYIIMSFVGGISGKGVVGGIGSGVLGIFIGIFFGLLYMLGTGVACWIWSILYNIISRFFGQLEVEVTSI